MKNKTLLIFLGMILGVVFSAQATVNKTATKAVAKSASQKASAKKKISADVGEALKPKKSLSFDGRTVEALQPGKFDSFTHLSEGDRDPKAAKLYSLPGDFTRRSQEESVDMGYPQ